MICHFLRALEYQPRDGRQLELHDLAPKIGEEPHSAPSVFGYFQPEHQPAGAVRSAGLVSPEAELLTAPFILGLANGLAELIDYGPRSLQFWVRLRRAQELWIKFECAGPDVQQRQV